jgi:phosphoribosyl 1,2-cyclic phosphodiesterase/CheY-like chemotaxis protein
MARAKTVLIIDDESEYRKVLGEILQQHGWQVWQADDGEAGLSLAKTHQPAAVLLDLMMARGNGFQVCRAMRQEPSLRQTRIVIVSGRDFPSDRRMAFEVGADEYLTKPVAPARLLELLARLLDPGEATPPALRVSPSQPAPGLRLKFWGVRGSIATPGPSTLHYGGNTSCLEVRVGGRIIILDAGTGLRGLGRALLEEFKGQPLDLTLLLTHTHWDHIQGLPFFTPLYQPQHRLRILGFEGAKRGLTNVLANQMESPFFPVGLEDLPSNLLIEELKELSFELGPVQVQVHFAYHPGICVGYRLLAGGHSIAYFPDNELRLVGRRSPPGAHSSDTDKIFARQESQKLSDFLRGTDVLVLDSQYDSQEYKSHIGWGHGCLDEVVELALEAEVKQLFLFHHDPEHDDAKISRMVAEACALVAARKGALQVEAAREGLVVELS